MIEIKVLGPGCPKCKATYQNVLKALDMTKVKANVEKVEDIEEMLKFNVLTTPVLMVNGESVVKGRTPMVSEIVELLKK